MQRGEVRRFRFYDDAPDKYPDGRPGVIVLRPADLGEGGKPVVAAITRTCRNKPWEVALYRDRDAVPQDSYVNCTWLMTLPLDRVVNRTGEPLAVLSPEVMNKVDQALLTALDLDPAARAAAAEENAADAEAFGVEEDDG